MRGGGGGVIFGDLSLLHTSYEPTRDSSSSFCCFRFALTCATALIKQGMSHARGTYWPEQSSRVNWVRARQNALLFFTVGSVVLYRYSAVRPL